jgi:hypothetical protein
MYEFGINLNNITYKLYLRIVSIVDDATTVLKENTEDYL